MLAWQLWVVTLPTVATCNPISMNAYPEKDEKKDEGPNGKEKGGGTCLCVREPFSTGSSP